MLVYLRKAPNVPNECESLTASSAAERNNDPIVRASIVDTYHLYATECLLLEAFHAPVDV